MDNCFSSKLNVLGFSHFAFINNYKFKNIINNVKQKINSLINESDKEKLREGCRDLANYLIKNKSPPTYYSTLKNIWEGTLKDWVKPHYEKLNKHGICPVIMDENGKKLLELKYEEEDFCEKKRKYLDEIKHLKRGKSRETEDTYLRKCNEYYIWIEQKQNFFDTKKDLFGTCYQKDNPRGKKKKKTPEFICDLMNPDTYKKLDECPSLDKLKPPKPVSKIEEINLPPHGQETSKDLNKSQVPLEQEIQTESADRVPTKKIAEHVQDNKPQPQSKPSREIQEHGHSIYPEKTRFMLPEDIFTQPESSDTLTIPTDSESSSLVKIGKTESSTPHLQGINSTSFSGDKASLTEISQHDSNSFLSVTPSKIP
ncbi:PIR Superfamily Protein, partial [Plasmodium malariae]